MIQATYEVHGDWCCIFFQHNSWQALSPLNTKGYCLKEWDFNTFKPEFHTLTLKNGCLQPIVLDKQHLYGVLGLLNAVGQVDPSPIERVIKIYDNLVHSDYDGTTQLESLLSKVDFAR